MPESFDEWLERESTLEEKERMRSIMEAQRLERAAYDLRHESVPRTEPCEWCLLDMKGGQIPRHPECAALIVQRSDLVIWSKMLADQENP